MASNQKKAVAKLYKKRPILSCSSGDNLVDFADFSKTSEADRDKKLDELQKEFGEKFIIFPNPMYGSWETAVYQGKKLDAKGQTEERLKALQGFDK